MSAKGFDETLDRCSLDSANPQHFSPQAVILRVPQQAAGRPKAAGGLRRAMKPEGCEGEIYEKEQGAARWWQFKYFICSPVLREDSHFD